MVAGTLQGQRALAQGLLCWESAPESCTHPGPNKGPATGSCLYTSEW